MDDLISRQAAIDIAYPFDDNERNLIDALEDLPTADVRENVKAEKVVGGGELDGSTCWLECSECGCSVEHFDNYCSCCGAEFVRGEA